MSFSIIDLLLIGLYNKANISSTISSWKHNYYWYRNDILVQIIITYTINPNTQANTNRRKYLNGIKSKIS